MSPGTVPRVAAADPARTARRHPAERRMSRVSGALLLVMIVQAAFGYSLVGLATSQWVRDVHFLVGLVVLGLAAVAAAVARMLPIADRRASALSILTRIVLALASVQLALGLVVKGWITADTGGITQWHIGLGLLVTLLIVIVHVLSIGPSILLSAAKEHEKGRADLDARRSR